ncbi:MAG TPA: Mpo1-like protein [Candidatus Binatia bacterium]|jgi:hypothetical protein|nr:Mpo1-like protein [Candidatus Binatia bacterium]
MRERTESFDAFYAGYLTAHRHPLNRALHLAAKVAALTALVVAAWRWSLPALLAAPLLAVLPCWAGHLAFERNRPTSWTRPSASVLGGVVNALTGRAATPSRPGRFWYSFAADLRMCGDLLRPRH